MVVLDNFTRQLCARHCVLQLRFCVVFSSFQFGGDDSHWSGGMIDNVVAM